MRAVWAKSRREQRDTSNAEILALRAEVVELKRALQANGSDSPLIGSYQDASVAGLIRSRAGWLALFLLSLSLTSVVMGEFEHTLSRQIELAYFVPLLIGHGGNAGGQTIGAVLAAMSAGTIRSRDWYTVVWKESLAGLGSGILTGVAVVPLLAVMRISLHVSMTVAITLPILTVMATGLAAGLPFIVAAVGEDPSIIAAPAMTTAIDVGGLLAYFLVARSVFITFGLDF